MIEDMFKLTNSLCCRVEDFLSKLGMDIRDEDGISALIQGL
jgi:hypothetical protein